MLAFLAVALLPHFDLAAVEKPRVVRLADQVLSVEPRTIVSVVNPRSAGGPHDFSSDGDYWWPNPKDPNGPYIQRDGMSNPDNFVAHRELMFSFARTVGKLSAAYKLTGDERYAAAAAKHLHAWFVDPATRMNPNLKYAQAIHGITVGRGTGVIDTVHLCDVALGVEALRNSKSLGHEDEAAVTQWFRDYLHWMNTDPNGIEERDSLNNHADCWVLQASCFAHLAGDQQMLETCRERFKTDLLPHQMAPDGSFTREVMRTKPYGYSLFVLDIMTSVAQILSTPKENLITWSLPDGRCIAKGIAFMAPFIADKDAWLATVHKPRTPEKGQSPALAPATNPLVKPDVMYWTNWPVAQPALLFGALATGREDWLSLWQKLDEDPTVEEIQRNLPVRQPVLWVKE
jgi:hypothetical protein